MNPIIYRERKIFLAAAQTPSENVTEWLTRLQHLATPCAFGDNLNDFLTTQFICGLASKHLFDVICKQVTPLSLNAIYQLCIELQNHSIYSETFNSANIENVTNKANETNGCVVPSTTEITSALPIKPVNTEDHQPAKPPPARKISRFMVSPAMESLELDQLITEANNNAPCTLATNQNSQQPSILNNTAPDSQNSASQIAVQQNNPSQCVPQQNNPPQLVPQQNNPPKIVPQQNYPPQQNIPLQFVPPQNIQPQLVPQQFNPSPLVPQQFNPPQLVPQQNISAQLVSQPFNPLTFVPQQNNPQPFASPLNNPPPCALQSNNPVQYTAIQPNDQPPFKIDADATESPRKSTAVRKISRFSISAAVENVPCTNVDANQTDVQTVMAIKPMVLPLVSDLATNSSECTPTKSSPDRVSAWEQLKIGLENITHAQVQTISKLKEAAQSPISDSFPGSPKRILPIISPEQNILKITQTDPFNVMPSSPPNELNVQENVQQQIIYSSEMVDASENTTANDKLHNVPQTIDTSLSTELASRVSAASPSIEYNSCDVSDDLSNSNRSNLRFVRNSLETSSLNLIYSKSNYFDTDTIEMEYPRNLDDNIEMLSREAEHLEEQFTATAEEKLLHYVPKEPTQVMVNEDEGEENYEEDEDEAIGMSPCRRFFKYDKEVGFGSFKTVFRGLDAHTGVAVAWCELLVSF